MKTLQFHIDVPVPPREAWSLMLHAPSYDAWTAAFCEGSRYEGSWDPGSRIRFLGPNGDGMVAQIAENRPGRFVAIRHLGEIRDGVEDTTSEKVRAWAPAREEYTFTPSAGGTRIQVAVDTVPEYQDFMQEAFPRALARLKDLCEAQLPAGTTAFGAPEDDRTIVSRRRVRATPHEVFAAFADPARLARWWGPAGFRNSFDTFELRDGGRWRFTMHGPDGTDYPNDATFVVVDAPSRLVLRHHPQPGFTLAMGFAPAGGGCGIEWRQCFDTAELKRKLEGVCRPANEQNFDRLEAELAAGH